MAPASAQATGSPTWSWTDQLGASAQRLRGGLHGDRVAVSQTTDLRLWVSLPTDTAFAPGRAAVKPPATGWLDQVALALRDLPRAEVQIVSDADAGGSESGARVLALERAASARDWLVIRGVSPRRISVGGRSSPRGVRATEPRRLDILIGERARTQGDNAK